MGTLGFFGGGVFILLFWVLLDVGIIYLVKHTLNNGNYKEGGGDRAIEILRERYAKGEITKEEFE